MINIRGVFYTFYIREDTSVKHMFNIRKTYVAHFVVYLEQNSIKERKLTTREECTREKKSYFQYKNKIAFRVLTVYNNKVIYVSFKISKENGTASLEIRPKMLKMFKTYENTHITKLNKCMLQNRAIQLHSV